MLLFRVTSSPLISIFGTLSQQIVVENYGVCRIRKHDCTRFFTLAPFATTFDARFLLQRMHHRIASHVLLGRRTSLHVRQINAHLHNTSIFPPTPITQPLKTYPPRTPTPQTHQTHPFRTTHSTVTNQYPQQYSYHLHPFPPER